MSSDQEAIRLVREAMRAYIGELIEELCYWANELNRLESAGQAIDIPDSHMTSQEGTPDHVEPEIEEQSPADRSPGNVKEPH